MPFEDDKEKKVELEKEAQEKKEASVENPENILEKTEENVTDEKIKQVDEEKKTESSVPKKPSEPRKPIVPRTQFTYVPRVSMSYYEDPPDPPKPKMNQVIIHAIGQALYYLGLYVELQIHQIMHAIKSVAIFIAQVIAWVFVSLFTVLKKIGATVWRDVTTPIRNFFKGVRNMRNMAREQKKEGKSSAQIWKYFFDGVKNNGHLLQKTVGVGLSIFALGVFVFTATSLLSMKYALFVSVGDVEIGYVENETVLEDGLSLLRMRLSLATDQNIDQWEFTPTLSVSPTVETLDKTEVADKILQNSSEEIQTGYGIYIDEVLVGATQDAQTIVDFLEAKKQPYREEAPDAQVEFVRDVEVSEKEEVFLAETIQSTDDIEQELSTEVSKEENYTVKTGDNLSKIVKTTGITLEELIARNPELEGQNGAYEPAVGTVLLIQNAKPYLQIQTIFTEEADEVIPFETIKEEVSTRPMNQQATVQQGSNGKEHVVYELSYIDDELISKTRVEEECVITVPVQNKIIEVGTNAALSTISGGGEGFIWPVPDAKYSSRGMSSGHRGLDINASLGTPVYAIGNGTVIQAGWHYSYGNYIEIQHKDGIVSLYGHNSQLLVSVGDTVKQGDEIALIGSTGNSTGNHLHLEIQVNGVLNDPYNYVIPPDGFRRGS